MGKEIKQCQNCKNSFEIASEDMEFYNKISVPAPTFCPDCRTQRRMMFRNERSLYRRKCDAPGHVEETISAYSSDKNLITYDQKYWWSDEWDPLSYGKDYDFSKPFFQQLKELRDNFPLQIVSNSDAVNSDFCNVADRSKDCYLISASFENERCIYSNRVLFSKDVVDVYLASKNEFCYELISSHESYKLMFGKDSKNCMNSAFIYNCHNCSNCFGCTNLRGRSFCIFNEQYSKEEYNEKVKEFDFGSYKNLLDIKEKFKKIYGPSLRKYANIIKSVDVSGDNIITSKNCRNCFDAIETTEDCKYSNYIGVNLKDSYDVGPGVGDAADLLYETFDSTSQISRIFASHTVYNSYNIRYSNNCHGSSNLFGCIGLRNKQYCILNKQYTKEEYEELVPKIIQHINDMPYIDKKGRVYKYGEFFPPEISPFAYNETIAQEYFPLTKEQALEQGYSWKDPEERNIQPTITSQQLPDHIKDVTDDITKEIIECEHKGECNEQCTQAFKIIPQELEFYRKMNLPLPRLCPNCRHYQRIKQRNPLKLWKRKCQCNGKESVNSNQGTGKYQNTSQHSHGDQPCHNEFETTYAPERPEIVYCEGCYQAEVV